MSELLHTWALAPAAVGTCCLAADRRRVRVPELAASVLMLLAMLDAASGRLVASVYWAALLLATAIALAAVRSRERRGPRTIAHRGGMTLHTTLGLVVMAVLLLGMGAATTGEAPIPATASPDAHHHGGAGGSAAILLLLCATAYAAASAIAAIRARGILNRLQYALMGAATAAMGVSAVLA